jgi:hypothetical protein
MNRGTLLAAWRNAILPLSHSAPTAQVQTVLANHVAAMAPAALIGVLAGLLAIGFTVINLKVARLRIQVLQARPGGSRRRLLRARAPIGRARCAARGPQRTCAHVQKPDAREPRKSVHRHGVTAVSVPGRC